MKKIILTTVALTSSLTFFAQNTFPTSGNVGIGTTSPEAKLHIKNSYTSMIAEGSIYLKNADADVDKKNWYLRANDEGNLNISTARDNYSWKKTILNFNGDTGNIGIGTDNPKAGLHIANKYTSIIAEGSIYLKNADADVDKKNWYFRTGDDGNLRLSRANDNYSWTETVLNFNGDTGNVGIGTSNPDSELTVKGKIHCEEVQVDLAVPADYVFEKYYTGVSELKAEYTMPTLAEVETYTKENHHLPNIPSAAEIKEEGLHLKEMTNLLLQKVEELTLYTIEQHKEIKLLKEKVSNLEN